MEDFGFGSSLKDALSDSVYFYEIASRDWREPEYTVDLRFAVLPVNHVS